MLSRGNGWMRIPVAFLFKLTCSNKPFLLLCNTHLSRSHSLTRTHALTNNAAWRHLSGRRNWRRRSSRGAAGEQQVLRADSTAFAWTSAVSRHVLMSVVPYPPAHSKGIGGAVRILAPLPTSKNNHNNNNVLVNTMTNGVNSLGTKYKGSAPPAALPPARDTLDQLCKVLAAHVR
jgi:hypothetical protein